ncbi:hypothetical protein JDV02_001424 [Purpureocillium takamizusanense]|uniref:F-box domain-containing protein n=1 Tax=Purpureocillium takamizusanense TaxID=2060973 RepID=A0A9Q8Q960_9HYPO|nr:uncharacterized protein JDV02_001424 [Purpureocillium takamizusanense]UNI14833.1 hypothetical protein JDV02_001424 [Purpureocillium takamizusanense]
MSVSKGLVKLPWDVFTEIILAMAPYDTLRLRRVSRSLKNELDNGQMAIRLIRHHFPRARESRELRAFVKNRDGKTIGSIDWALVFRLLVRRYYNIGNAKFWKQRTQPMVRRGANMAPFMPMDRYIAYKSIIKPLHLADPLWSFDPEPGLLVYPGPEVHGEDGLYQWYMLDVATNKVVQLPFDSAGLVVRRVRLSHGVLIFEWCRQWSEEHNHHRPNTAWDIREHFVTALDVIRSRPWNGISHVDEPTDNDPFSWDFEYRGQWELEPLNPRADRQCDRMFSDHNATHYIAYYWRAFGPNHTQNWEAVRLWDIRREAMEVAPVQQPGNNLVNASAVLVKEFRANYLAFCLGSQIAAPGFISIRLDDCTWNEQTRSVCGHFYITEEFHPWLVGSQVSPMTTRVHGLLVTGMPLTGIGPEWSSACGNPLFAATGGHDLSFGLCKIGPHTRRIEDPEAIAYLGDILLDSDSEEDEEVDHGGDVSSVHQAKPKGYRPYRFAKKRRQTGSGSAGSGCYAYEFRPPTARQLRQQRGEKEPTDDELMQRDLDETLPGRPPCWRHDQFPNINIAQAFDAAAGVRIIAQTDIITAAHSSLSRPVLRVESDVEAAYTAAGSNDDRDECEAWRFGPNMWSKLMGRQVIFGDERWIVGEGPNGTLTICIF